MSAATALPAGITCPDWKLRTEGSKRCAYYIPPDAAKGEIGALCNLDSHFLCVEWEKVNPALIDQARIRAPAKALPIAPRHLEALPSPVVDPSSKESPTSPSSPAGQADLFSSPSPPAPATPAVRLAPGPLQPSRPTQPTPAPEPAYRPAKEIPAEDVQALEALGVEICLVTKSLDREVWLVPTRTGTPDRFELTFREAATLRLIVDAFPGARVTAIRTLAQPKPKGSPQ